MNLLTNYMGLTLENPIIVGSSKFTANFENVKKCINAGAGAIVLKSIFEEELQTKPARIKDQNGNNIYHPETLEYIKNHSNKVGLERYLEHIKSIRTFSEIPLIASINCFTHFEWPCHTALFERAGADALELNISIHPFDVNTSSIEIENMHVTIVKEVKKYVNIPVCVKLRPQYTNISNMCSRLQKAGTDSFVIFNRIFMSDIDIKKKQIIHNNLLSAPQEVNNSLHWVNILSSQLNCDIAASTGIHDSSSLIKQLLVGAKAVQICSVLHNKGIGYIDTLLYDLISWMKKNDYHSIDEFRGAINIKEENTIASQRISYMKNTLE